MEDDLKVNKIQPEQVVWKVSILVLMEDDLKAVARVRYQRAVTAFQSLF